jgi:hypothetical protein
MGFGGGTGPPNPPFGSNNNSSSQQQPTAGFGAPAAFGNPAPTSNANASFNSSQTYGGFGAAQSPPNHPFGGGAGFGTNTSPPPPTAFGQPAAAAPGITFGASSNLGPFGSTASSTNSTTGGGGFGQPAFGAPAAPSTGGGFGGTGSSTTYGGYAGTGFGAQAPAPSTGFSASNFGGSSGSSYGGGFGGSPSAPVPTSYSNQPFGATASSSSNFQSSTTSSSLPNPFGAVSTAPASAVTFGMSSNVVASSGFGNNSSDSDMYTSSPIPPYGFGSPMPQNTDNEDMGDDHNYHFGGQQQPASNLPFGTPATTTSAWSAPSSSTFGGPGSLSPIPETGGFMPNAGQSPITADAGGHAAPSDNTSRELPTEDGKLAQLKARIEEKKRRLEEQKRKKEAVARVAAAATAEVASEPLNAKAPVFAPSAKAPAFVPSVKAPAFAPSASAAGPQSAAEKQSMAEKNAIRFSSNNNSEAIRVHMPADLRAMADSNSIDYSSLNIDKREEAQDLENAVSLIGTCMHMCPDEELLRRESEGDIQLLEIPQPGKLHPVGWTLRNTVVKRFRRSAADYKLDYPDWVRPPDVLEKVCGYLEEWVMVRF